MGFLCMFIPQVAHLAGHTMIIRLASLSDASDIYRIHTFAIREICSKYYKEEEINQWVERQSEKRYVGFIEKSEMLVAEDDEQNVIGFGHLSENEENSRENPAPDEKQVADYWKVGEIRALYVHPSHIRKNVGQTLLKYMEEKAKKKHARELVVYSTVNAIPFYEGFGFKVVGKAKHECGQGVNLQCTKLSKII